MAFVTLPGASGGTVTVQSGSGDNVFVAQIIANTILLASAGGSLKVNSDVVGSGVNVAPPTTAGGPNILYLSGSGGGTLAVPTGYDYIVDLMTGPETITGSNAQLISYDTVGTNEFVITGASSIAN